MKDAAQFRAQAAHCLALQRSAKRIDVQQALRCLAQEYEAAARAVERAPGDRAGAPTVARPPLTWPMLATQRYMAALVRMSLALWLPLG
ncbi:MAG TPA: hypothetical protein VN681_09805 [Stellaceae bacterium]|nr:hypothetical protein [Stellaceae bacterium]